MRAVLFAISAILLISSALTRGNAASADRLWYVIDYGADVCVPAALLMPKSPTPELFARNVTGAGSKVAIYSGKDKHGGLRFVQIIVEQAAYRLPISMFWFPSKTLCGAGRQAAKAAGVIPQARGQTVRSD